MIRSFGQPGCFNNLSDNGKFKRLIMRNGYVNVADLGLKLVC